MNPHALFKLSYGLYIISSIKEEKLNGQIANVASQITSNPPLIVTSINKENLTHEYILSSKVFTISILSKETTMQFIGRFGFRSGRDIDKFSGVKYRIGTVGAPIVLENSIAYIEAKVKDSIDCGTHTLFIGEITDADNIREGEPMTYSYYHEIKKGKSPKTAPTYIKDEKSK